MSRPVVCPVCATPAAPAATGFTTLAPCPACATPLLVRVFPALDRAPAPGQTAARLTDEGQSSCFYHPQSAAHLPCDGCGRFLCALCDVELHDQHLCPACLESGVRKGGITTFQTRRVLWDSIALWTAVLPVLLCGWLTVISAPVAIALAVIGWRKPRSIVPRWVTFRFVAAVVVSLLSIVGITVLIFFIINSA